MSSSLKKKVLAFLQTWDHHYGKPERPAVAPPSSSADVNAVAAVAEKNAQIVAGVVLGLHGPPAEGVEAARKLMQHFVDWNEVRVARTQTLITVLGKQPRAAERVALLRRFLEVFFTAKPKHGLNLDDLVTPGTAKTMKPGEMKRFLSEELQFSDREELAALLLVGFHHRVFPPAAPLREVAEQAGLIWHRTTTLQMAEKFETALDADQLYALYSHLYSLANDPERKTLLARHKKKK